MRAVLSLIVLAVSIAGCGYKGPLYLPKPKPEAQKPAPAPASVPPLQEDRKPASE
jgi:predicted small lipoprotein YifL